MFAADHPEGPLRPLGSSSSQRRWTPELVLQESHSSFRVGCAGKDFQYVESLPRTRKCPQFCGGLHKEHGPGQNNLLRYLPPLNGSPNASGACDGGGGRQGRHGGQRGADCAPLSLSLARSLDHSQRGVDSALSSKLICHTVSVHMSIS